MSKKQKNIVQKLVDRQKIRFGIVGTVNTAVDFSTLFLLVVVFGLQPVFANAGSTSVALTVSYFLNKKTVFGDTDMHNIRQITLFIGVTLFGLWVLQGLVIMAVPTVVWMVVDTSDEVALLIAKIIATLVTLVWNYTWYSRVIFNKDVRE